MRILATLAVLGVLTLRVGAQLTVDNVLTNGLFEPYGVAADLDNIVYVTDSANHRIVRFDPNTGVSTTIAGIPGESGNNDGPSYLAHLNSPQGIVLTKIGGVAGLIIGDTGNHLIRFVNLTNGTISTLAGVASVAGNLDAAVGTSAKFRSPIGLAVDGAGILYIADSRNNLIRQINLADPNFAVVTLAVSGTTFREPNDVAVLGANQLWIADTRNHTIKLVTRTGPASATLTTSMGSNDQGVPGSADNSFGANARFNNPRGLLFLGGAGLVISDTGNQTIRLAASNPVFGPTNYAVSTLAGIAGQSGYVNGPALAAKFSAPHGLARDALGNGFLIADTANSVIRRIQTGETQPPVDTPQIGWVDFPPPLFTSVLRIDQPFVFNNDVIVAILSEQATETFFTFGPTPPSPVEDSIPSPGRLVGATPPAYRNGLFRNEVAPSIITPQPDVTVKAIGTQDGRRSSEVDSARFQFKTANPNITGDNAAGFNVASATTNAVMWYTTDGTDPTNALPSIGPLNGNSPLSLVLSNNGLTFKVRAFKTNYKPSDVVSKVFSDTNFVPNRISFGFEAGEASSEFVASPGQLFYTPVTLSILPGTKVYSLQFNLTVTNAGPNPGPAVMPGAVRFESFLQKPIPNTTPVIYETIPPAAFLGLIIEPEYTQVTNHVPVTDFYEVIVNSLETNWFSTNALTATVTNGNRLITNYVTTTLVGTNIVGRVQRDTNLLNVTTYQTNVPAGVGHSFKLVTSFVTLGVDQKVLEVPTVETDVVQIPSAFNPPPGSQIFYPFDGIMPFVDMTFTNRSQNLLGVGWLERSGKKNLYDTTMQDLIKYSQPHDTQFLEEGGRVVLGGYAFQVPLCATNGQSYQIQIGRPSATSDGIGAPGSDVYIATPTNGSLTVGPINAIKTVTTGQRKYIAGDVYPFRWFNAGDFGKGHLANADAEQVFQSALYDLNYPPFGSDFFDAMDSCGFTYADNGNGYLEIEKPLSGPDELNPLFDGDDTDINQIGFGDGTLDVCDVYVTFRRSLDPSLVWFRRFWTNTACTAFRAAEIVGNAPLPGRLGRLASTNPPAARFASADFVAAAGQTIQIPITAQIAGTYPLRTLMLSLSVDALDGSPVLTSPIQFEPNPALGQPTFSDSKGNGNYAATWLNNAISGLTGSATLGTLTVRIPANAGSSAAYAIHFDHASASPNGLASFPKQTQTGLITLSDRSAPANDGIPDSWRLRNFGSLNNVLSEATADADADGANNLQEFKAGTDPNDINSVLRLKTAAGQPRECVVRWPSVSGKQYVIERAASVYSPLWTPISTNSGTGLDMEFHDTGAGAGPRFYRVRVLE